MRNGIKKHLDYLRKSVDRNWKTALDLFKTKHYDACLFFCHLALEKSLKRILAEQTGVIPPLSHDLAYLAKQAGLLYSSEQMTELNLITSFNIAGRYDDEKHQFYKKCTSDFAKKYLKISEDLFIWLKNNYPAK